MEAKKHTRPPVVVVMGHVDHGKTTLLDYIRKTNTAAREAGGITQSVGAYEIEHVSRKITFIDTPGHEAFIQMRSAGANIADLAILVVAADEGIKPQTKEAIDIITRTKTPFIVALNKIDKPDANIERMKKELAETGVLLEGYGGQISFHGVSAKTGEGVNDLLDLILLSADLQELTYDPAHPAEGFVLEATVDRRRGNEVTLILKNGTLKAGSYIATPSAKGKVRMLEDFTGTQTKQLEPSAPAVVIGFEKLPGVGEEFRAGDSEASLAHLFKDKPEEKAAPKNASGDTQLRVLLKAADAGSLEALSLTIRNLNVEVKPAIVSESVGDITDGDVKHAIATDSMIIGFKNRMNSAAKNLAEAHEVIVITSEIIYDLVKVVEEALKKPEDLNISGELEVLAVFNQAKTDKQLVGGKVVKGLIRNKAAIEIERNETVIGKGRIQSLQSQKKDVGQVGEGSEAGLILGAEIMIQTGDRLIMRKHHQTS